MALQAIHVGPSSFANAAETDRRLLNALTGGRYGVVGTGFAVTPGTGLQVAISAGDAFVKGIAAGSGGYFISDSASATAAIGSNASGSNRVDAIVLAVGDTQYGALGGSMGGVQTPRIFVLQGTTVAPTDSAINTAVGSGGWFRLADVIVPNGAASIISGNITNYGGPSPLPASGEMQTAFNSSGLSLTTTTPTLIPGLSITLNVPDTTAKYAWSYDCLVTRVNGTIANARYAIADLFVDGTGALSRRRYLWLPTGTALIHCAAGANGILTGLSKGTHTLEVRGYLDTAAASDYSFGANQSSLTVQRVW